MLNIVGHTLVSEDIQGIFFSYFNSFHAQVKVGVYLFNHYLSCIFCAIHGHSTSFGTGSQGRGHSAVCEFNASQVTY
ncbi:Uncharacterised protein [Chlamydia trachomatis]|nr:Uncharacterised protein [Chlamydia trachomatis]